MTNEELLSLLNSFSAEPIGSIISVDKSMSTKVLIQALSLGGAKVIEFTITNVGSLSYRFLKDNKVVIPV